MAQQMVRKEISIGDKMPDGTIFAGISPETNNPMYTTPANAPLKMTLDEAKDHAAKLNAHGHKDWRLPTKAELNLLFQNRAEIRGFDMSTHPADSYWSSSMYGIWYAWSQRFTDGAQTNNNLINGVQLSVRLVR